MARFHVPELDCSVHASGQQEAIVGGEDEAVDVELVIFDREEFFAGLHVPHQRLDVHSSILFWIESDVAGRNQFPVVAEGD